MIPLLPQLNMEGIKAALIENYSVASAAKKTKEILDIQTNPPKKNTSGGGGGY